MKPSTRRKKRKEIAESKRRNISWFEDIDAMAVELAHERKCQRGVSELLENLVRAERDRKRGITHLHGRAKGNGK